MRQTSCKRLSIFLITICIFIFSAQAQDSSKTVTSAPKKTTTQSPSRQLKRPAVKEINRPPSAATTAPVAKTPVTSQTPPKPLDNSLNGQYEELLKHSWMQQGYKVVNPARLTALWKNVNDSLNNNKQQLAAARQKLKEQEKQLAGLKNQTTTKKSSPTAHSQLSSNNIQILGMYVDTETYNLIVWGLIIVLALALATILFTTTKNSSESKHHKQLYDEISAEYQAYKAKSKEKELKLARELQTERNTIEELLAKRNEATDPGKRGKKM